MTHGAPPGALHAAPDSSPPGRPHAAPITLLCHADPRSTRAHVRCPCIPRTWARHGHMVWKTPVVVSVDRLDEEGPPARHDAVRIPDRSGHVHRLSRLHGR